MVLSHGLWQRRFGSDPAIIGQALALDGESHTVVGVVPTWVSSGLGPPFDDTDLWLRAIRHVPEPPDFAGDRDADVLTNRGAQMLFVIGRLAAAATLSDARAEMATIAQRLADQYPDTNEGKGVRVNPLNVGDTRQDLLVLFGAVAFVLLIACANVANLVLARAAGREREWAVRSALGAGRPRLVRQLLAESVVLSLLGGGLAVLLALWGVDGLLALNPDTLPRQQELGIDRWVLAFTLMLALWAAIGSGLAPALHASSPNCHDSLAEGSRGSRGRSRRRLQRSLVVAEVALAVVLLVGAGLLARTFLELQRVAPGFESQGVLVLSVFLPESRYAGAAQLTAFYADVVERLASLPGVHAATAVSGVPFGPARSSGQFAVEVAVINETMSRRYWPDQSPLGHRIGGGDTWFEIVGVVGDVKNDGLERPPQPEVHVPHHVVALRYADLVVKTGSAPSRFAETVRTALRAVDADLPVMDIRTMDEIVGESVADRRFYMLLLTVFAGLAIGLAAVGIYGLMAHAVSQRTAELGIRMALGASRSDVYRVVLREGLVLSLLGAAIGAAGAFWATRLLASELYGVTATDPLTFATGVVALMGVAVLACYIPARRATKVDPVVALRGE